MAAPTAITYQTHFNGLRPWSVTVRNGNDVTVHSTDENAPEKPVLDGKMHEVFVGKSPLCQMTAFSGGHGPQFDGNTVLLRTSADELEYIHLERSMLRFRTDDPIVEFVSPVGNNLCPYPYAIDSKGRTYLIDAGVVLDSNVTWSGAEFDDPYSYYYRHDLITADFGVVPRQEPMQTWPGIARWRIGDRAFTMRYDPKAVQHYDQLIEDWDGSMTIENSDGAKHELTKQAYVDLMEKVGEQRGFKPMQFLCA